MFISSSGGLWQLRLRAGKLNLWLPLPLYVLTDLLVSLSDLCEVILPRFGLPNYAGALYELFKAVVDVPMDAPLVEIHADGLDLVCKRFEWGGN